MDISTHGNQPPVLKDKNKNIASNLLYSGRNEFTDRLTLRYLFFINSFSIIGFVSVVGFGAFNIMTGNYTSGVPEFIGGWVFLLNLIFLRITSNIGAAKVILLSIQLILLMILLMTGGIERTGILWFFTFPVSAFFLLGVKKAAISMFILFDTVLSIYILASMGFTNVQYSLIEIRQLFGVLLIISALIYIYQKTVEDSEQQIYKNTKEPQEYIDAMSTFTAKIAPNGQILFANKIAKQASGVGEAVIGMNFLEGSWWSFEKTVQERVANNFKDALTGKNILYDELLKVTTPEGPKVIKMNFSMTPVLEKGKVLYILAEGRNISGDKKADK